MKLFSELDRRGINYETHQHLTAYTAQGLAQAEHVSGYLVAKPVVVKGPTGFTMCVVSAPDHLDLKRVAEALGETEVWLATESELADLFPDCELGAEPPVGSLFGMKTVMDPRLKDDEYLIMQAGSHTESIKIKRDDWEKLCQPVIAPIVTN